VYIRRSKQSWEGNPPEEIFNDKVQTKLTLNYDEGFINGKKKIPISTQSSKASNPSHFL
jgi:hypothetical protein